MKVDAVLTITISYSDVESFAQVKANLYAAAQYLANEGMLDGPDMTVDAWDANVGVIKKDSEL